MTDGDWVGELGERILLDARARGMGRDEVLLAFAAMMGTAIHVYFTAAERESALARAGRWMRSVAHQCGSAPVTIR